MIDIDKLEDAIWLRNRRQCAIDLQTAAGSGSLHFVIAYCGAHIDVLSVIDDAPIRNAVVKACDDAIASCEKRLSDLGVRLTSTAEDPPAGYRALPAGMHCKCPFAWTDARDNGFCRDCGAEKEASR